MRAYKYLHRAPVRVIRINRKAQKLKLRRLMLSLKLALHQEKVETREMLDIYKRHTRGKASKEELAVAHAQFFDVLRGIGLGVFAILPFAPITIPVIVKLGRLVGVEVIPSAFIAKKPLKGDSREL
ncbi:hypothetical protein N7931_13430 [Catenovulum sp. 2E275]|uniref:hypothetical protein n=1 Tax=Catenovulum sp. 2E275 TaxID=2980497 RepID=UPI0021D14E7F|nr:hypothetical protein [Catenovulum sp. 2E275]MCU4676634.1 hypothetical protein [Catenovulum sp. 2E275]